MGSAAAETHTISPHRPMIVATGSPERAELVAGMVEHVHVIGKNTEGELVGGQGNQRLIVST
jgi:hypothetical protein